MIVIYIIGAILFLVQLYVIKHTYWVRVEGLYNKREHDKLLQPVKTPVWVVLVGIIIIAIPYLGTILENLLFWTVYAKRYSEPDELSSFKRYTYWRFKDEILSKPI